MTHGVETPELDKALSLNTPRKPFDVLSEFWDWLEGNDYVIAKYGRPRERFFTCTVCKGRKINAGALTPRQRQLLHKGHLPDGDWPECPRCEGTGREREEYVDEDSLAPAMIPPDRLFAEFWGLDQNAMDREKRELLTALSTPTTTMRRCRNCQRRMSSPTMFCCEWCEMMSEDDGPNMDAARRVLAAVMSHAPEHDEFQLGVNDSWVHFDVKVTDTAARRSGWWRFGIWLSQGDGPVKLFRGEDDALSAAMETDETHPDEAWL